MGFEAKKLIHFNTRVIMNLYFKSTTLDKQIGWTWKDMDKAYWDTWIPKKSDIKIITRLNKEQKKQALDEHEIETMQEEDRKDLHKKKKYDRLQTLNTKTKPIGGTIYV
jgi:hypothetical protein